MQKTISFHRSGRRTGDDLLVRHEEEVERHRRRFHVRGRDVPQLYPLLPEDRGPGDLQELRRHRGPKHLL